MANEYAKYAALCAALAAVLVLVPKWLERSAGQGEPAVGVGVASSGAARKTPPSPDADLISVSSLLDEMTDLTRLTRSPEPPYVAHLASSYDRRSRSPQDVEGWFANDDWASNERPNYERVEDNAGRREYVLAEISGPGALVRLWTATPTGTLRIYLDGAKTPTLAEPLTELLSGGGSFPRALAYVSARGYNSFVPIPFKSGCKVTIDNLVAKNPFGGGPLAKFYYQINYRSYPPSVAEHLRSFDQDELRRAAPALARATRVLEEPARAYEPAAAHDLVSFASTPSGAELRVESVSGARIREILLRLADTSDAALRSARLELAFDDEIPVDVPLGDFFGGGPGLSPFESLPLSVRADGSFVSRWPMPFAKRATIRVRGSAGVEGEARLESAPFDAQSLYFRAEWRESPNVATRPFRDFSLLDVRGRGLFVGSAFAITNPAGANWWGEGDDKAYVDGEAFPSLFGTGTEDYYGYAWSTGEIFARPFHSQTRAEGPGFGGRFAMNRFQFLDAIPFSQALRFDLELWHSDATTVSYSSMAYYYGRLAALRSP